MNTNSRSGSVKSESEFAVGRSNERLSGSAGAQIAEDAAGDADAAMMRRSGSDETSDDILAKYRKKATNRLDDYGYGTSIRRIYYII